MHDWDDARCGQIVRECGRATREGVRLVLLEPVLPARMSGSGTEQAFARSDLNLFVGLGRRKRTEAVFAARFASPGLQAARLVPAALGDTAIEHVPG